MTAWLHPLAAAATLALAAFSASLGLRGRGRHRTAEWDRRRHARLGPWVWSLVAANWAGGLATVRFARPDLETAASGHFAVGSAILVLFTAAALVSRRVPTDAWARAVHPWLGAAALLLSGVQVFLGLQFRR